jgi:hypothetical protein
MIWDVDLFETYIYIWNIFQLSEISGPYGGEHKDGRLLGLLRRGVLSSSCW